MNNYQWLLQMDGAERKAWFDAEHVEHQDGTLDGDTEPESEDSRELILTDLEKKTREWHDYDGNYMRIYSGVAYAQMKELLDRQAAVTEEKTRYKWVTASAEEIAAWRSKAEKLQAQVDELKAERVKLKSQICKLEDGLVRTSDERDNWEANCEDWKKHARAAENACYETMLEREDYRKKFGKCLDYADAIHALMDDEGMA